MKCYEISSRDSNPDPTLRQSVALPIELFGQCKFKTNSVRLQVSLKSCVTLSSRTRSMRTLSEIYEELESKRDLEFPSFIFDNSSFVEDEQPAMRLEFMTWLNMDMIDSWTALKEEKEQKVSYLKMRAEQTANPILRYRYYLFLYALTKDNRFAQKSIGAIISSLPALMSDDDKLFSAHSDWATRDLMKISKQIKDKRQDASSALWSILGSTRHGYKTKLDILGQAVEADFFGAVDAPRIVEICQGLFPLTADGWRERCCSIGLHYAAKMQKAGARYSAIFNKWLGDLEMSQLVDIDSNPNNILLPHLNHHHLGQAIVYYKLAGNNEKQHEAQRQYREVGPKLRYIHFRKNRPANKHVVQYFGNLKTFLLDTRPDLIVYSLVTLEGYMLPSVELLKEYSERCTVKDNTLLFEPAKVDINTNTHKEESVKHNLYGLYDTWIRNIMRMFIMDILLSAIAKGELTYGKLRNELMRKSSFGVSVKYTRGEEEFFGTWFSQIDFALKELFRQYKRVIAGKPTDWRIPIDVLPAKFEGMLRDIVGTEGGQINKVGKNQEIAAALLDDLLRDPVLKRIFTDEDILFFEYVFTSKGENIRNNVAHGFYKTCDYDIYKATLVFLSILRLAKYQRQ